MRGEHGVGGLIKKAFFGLGAWDWRFRCNWSCLFYIRMLWTENGRAAPRSSQYIITNPWVCTAASEWVGNIKVCYVHRDPTQKRG